MSEAARIAAIERSITRPLTLRRFRIECECAGAPFNWTGEAVNEAAAFSCAAHALAVEMPNVAAHQVRLVACIEVAA